MKYQIVISDEARLDILDSFLYYQQQQLGLGAKFENELSKSFEVIIQNPHLFQIKYLDIRICFTQKFPFGIHYLIENNIIRVFGIYHTKRSPSNWFDRF